MPFVHRLQPIPYAVLNTNLVSETLYKKLMIAECDTTARNLRVGPKANAADIAKKVIRVSFRGC